MSPIVDGEALKGPTAKILTELCGDASVRSVAAYYGPLIDTLVIDVADKGQAGAVRDLGIEPRIEPIVMSAIDDSRRLAARCVEMVRGELRCMTA